MNRLLLTFRLALIACGGATAIWSLGLATPIRAASALQDRDHAADAQHDAAEHVHPEAAKLKNPVTATPASIAAGKGLFEKQCVSCHGATGKGDGKSAAQLTPKPSDLTDARWKHGSSDGEIYTLIKDGSKNTGMRGFASKMTEQDMWNVVNYVRTLNTGK
jgi:mono/diheme cytochrome c family protein